MTLYTAIKLIEETYEKAKKTPYVHSPLPYALYQVWKMADEECAKKGGDK